MPSQTIDIWTGLPITKDQDDGSSPHSFSALNDCLVSSLRSGSDTSVSNISPGEKIGFHDSNDQTTLTMEMSDVDESSTEEVNDDGTRDQEPATTQENSFEHCSNHVRLSMCGAIHEFNDSDSDWSSVASAKEEIAVEESEILANEQEANQPVMEVHRRASNPLLPIGDDTNDRMVFPRRASNPLMLGRRFSAAGSRRDSVMSASMQEAFQLVRDTFEHPQPNQQQPEDEVSELGDDDDEFAGYYNHYGYEDAVPDDKNIVDSVAPANRKASIGQPHRQQDTTDYGYGDATPDSRAPTVDYGYGDAAPDQTTATDFQPSNAPPFVSWDVQEDDAAKYGYGECHLATRRQSGAHYDYGYGSDHDMDSTWHHGEKMPSNRILPHQDPAVIQDSQPKSRQRMQRNNSLRRSWNAQEQPRRRVQRRSSVTKFNLEDSMARVRREEEEEEEKVQEHTIPRTYSTLGAVDQQPQRKTKLRFIFRSKTKTTNSRKRLQGLRNMFIFGPRRSTASTIRERDSEPFTMSIDRPTSSARQPEAVPERNRRFRLWFRRRPKSQPVEI